MSHTQHDLLRHYSTDPYFYNLIQNNQANFSRLSQNITLYPHTFLSSHMMTTIEFQNQKIFFFVGSMCEQSMLEGQNLGKFFAHHFNPDSLKLSSLSVRYSFVFLNQQADSRVFECIWKEFGKLTLNHYLALSNLIIVNPGLYQRLQYFLVFSTLGTFIKSKIIECYSIQELSKIIRIPSEVIHQFLPNHLSAETLQKQNRFEENGFQKQVLAEHPNVSNAGIQMKAYFSEESSISKLNLFPISKSEIDDMEMSKLGIPLFIENVLLYFKINQHYILSEGIFRKNSSSEQIQNAIQRINNEGWIYMHQISDPIIVANLTKRFLNLLEQPLIPYHLSGKLMALSQNIQTIDILEIIESLPIINYTTLKFLMAFLKFDVVVSCKFNLMNSKSLAVVLSPCIMRIEEVNLESALKRCQIFQKMIENYEQIFRICELPSMTLDDQNEEVKQHEMKQEVQIIEVQCLKQKKQEQKSRFRFNLCFFGANKSPQKTELKERTKISIFSSEKYSYKQTYPKQKQSKSFSCKEVQKSIKPQEKTQSDLKTNIKFSKKGISLISR